MYFNPEIHKCPCCDFTSGMEKNVKKHIDKVHDGKCNLCKVKFKTTTRLKNHILSVHEKRKPYKCSSCNYRSSLKVEPIMILLYTDEMMFELGNISTQKGVVNHKMLYFLKMNNYVPKLSYSGQKIF